MRRVGGIVALLAVLALLAGACSSGDVAGPAPTSGARATVRVVSQNLLHGTACPPSSDRCHLPDRVSLFVHQLAAAGCPQLVAVQEANRRTVDRLRAAVRSACGGRYQVVWDGDPGLDREVVLSTLPVVASVRTRLAGPLRTAYWVRVRSPAGLVDLVDTHLASGSDDRPCAGTCPAPCRSSDTLRTCQARQAADLLESRLAPRSIGLLVGDLNARPGEPPIRVLRDLGYVDTHLAAGNAECDPATGTECTSGRYDEGMKDLDDPTSRETERIDYVWLATRRDCRVARPTGLFDAEPATDGPGGLAYPSDHVGVESTIACVTTAADRAAAAAATTLPSTTTTTSAPTSANAAARAGITAAYRTLFEGSVTDPERKLAAVQDAARIRSYFLQQYDSVQKLARRIHVQIVSVQLTDPTHAEVVYSILLDGATVLDHLPGGAVRSGGRWLVTLRTYCDVSTLGASTIPAPCR